MSAGDLETGVFGSVPASLVPFGTTDRNRRPGRDGSLACSTTVRASTLLRPRPTRSGRRPKRHVEHAGIICRARERVRPLRSSSSPTSWPSASRTAQYPSSGSGGSSESFTAHGPGRSPHGEVHTVLDGQLSDRERESRLRYPPSGRWASTTDSWSCSGPLLVEVDDDAVRHRVSLTGEHVAACDLIILQREVLVHLHLAIHDAGTASAAHPVLAGVRSVAANLQGGVQDRFALRTQRERRRPAVEDDLDLATDGGLAFHLRRPRGAFRRAGCDEELPVDAFRLVAAGDERVVKDVGQNLRTAEKPVVDVRVGQDGVQNPVEPIAVELNPDSISTSCRSPSSTLTTWKRAR